MHVRIAVLKREEKRAKTVEGTASPRGRKSKVERALSTSKPSPSRAWVSDPPHTLGISPTAGGRNALSKLLPVRPLLARMGGCVERDVRRRLPVMRCGARHMSPYKSEDVEDDEDDDA